MPIFRCQFCDIEFRRMDKLSAHYDVCRVRAERYKNVMQEPSREVVYATSFASSSSDKVYETIAYSDGTFSCNCPGWTKRVASDGTRSCKHTKQVNDRLAKRVKEQLPKSRKQTGCSTCNGSGMQYWTKDDRWMLCSKCNGRSSGMAESEIIDLCIVANRTVDPWTAMATVRDQYLTRQKKQRCSSCEGNGMIFEPRNANQWIRCPLCLGESSGLTKAELFTKMYQANMDEVATPAEQEQNWKDFNAMVTEVVSGANKKSKPKSPPTSVTPSKRKFEFD